MSRKFGFEVEFYLSNGLERAFLQEHYLESILYQKEPIPITNGEILGIEYAIFYFPESKKFEIVLDPIEDIKNLREIMTRSIEIINTFFIKFSEFIIVEPNNNYALGSHNTMFETLPEDYKAWLIGFDMSIGVSLDEIGIDEEDIAYINEAAYDIIDPCGKGYLLIPNQDLVTTLYKPLNLVGTALDPKISLRTGYGDTFRLESMIHFKLNNPPASVLVGYIEEQYRLINEILEK